MSQGSNSSALRQFNERIVICTLRKQGAASKPELAKLVGLTLQTLTRIVDDLKQREFIIPTGRRTQGVGQPSNIYQINPSALYSIGVNIDPDGIQCVLIDFKGQCLAQTSHHFSAITPEVLVNAITIETQLLLNKLSSEQIKKFVGIGIAMPWFLNGWEEMNPLAPELWLNFDLKKQLEAVLIHPIFYENNCTAAAAAEFYFGKAISAKNFLYIYMGAVIGGGLVLNGDLQRGIFGGAACLATMPVPASSLSSTKTESCTTLTKRASIGSLLKHLNFNKVNIQHSTELEPLLAEHKSLIQEWLLDCAGSLAYIIHSCTGLLDLEKIIIDADLPNQLLAELINIIQCELEKNEPSHRFPPSLQQGSLGVNPKAIGGAILPQYAHLAPDKSVILKDNFPDKKSSPRC